jgi:hypothetical protein
MFTVRNLHKFNYNKINHKLKSADLRLLKCNFNGKFSVHNVAHNGNNVTHNGHHQTLALDNITTTELFNKAVQKFYSKEATDPKPFDLPPQLELSMFDPNHPKTSDKIYAASVAAFLTGVPLWVAENDLFFPSFFLGIIGMGMGAVKEHYENKNNIVQMIKYLSPSCSTLFSRVAEVHERRKIVGISGGDEEIKNAIIKFLRETEN